jgi:hypothetical protein
MTGYSAAIELNLYSYYDTGTAFETDGVVPSTFTSVLNPELGYEPINVTIAYNPSAQTLTETLYGQITQATYTNTYTGVNLASILGNNSAYVGFTGSTGYDDSNQNISNFTFAYYSAGPATIANNVTAAPNTSSSIQLSISSGNAVGGIGALNIASGATVSVVSSSLDGIATRGTLTASSLSLAGATNSWTGHLDLANNSLDLESGTLSTVTNQVKQGYAGGTWQGTGGITSSAAAGDSTHLTALGVIVNDNGSGTPLYGLGGGISPTFGGATPVDGDILVKYTYYGDANLDGQVDGSDYARIDAGYLSQSGTSPLSGWYNGDFNYDGVIDGSDYTLIDNAYNTQGASLAAAIASPTAQIASGGATSVPEPATVGLIGIAALGLLGRRRKI